MLRHGESWSAQFLQKSSSKNNESPQMKKQTSSNPFALMMQAVHEQSVNFSKQHMADIIVERYRLVNYQRSVNISEEIEIKNYYG